LGVVVVALGDLIVVGHDRRVSHTTMKSGETRLC
jgi:hypothetical protein